MTIPVLSDEATKTLEHHFDEVDKPDPDPDAVEVITKLLDRPE